METKHATLDITKLNDAEIDVLFALQTGEECSVEGVRGNVLYRILAFCGIEVDRHWRRMLSALPAC